MNVHWSGYWAADNMLNYRWISAIHVKGLSGIYPCLIIVIKFIMETCGLVGDFIILTGTLLDLVFLISIQFILLSKQTFCRWKKPSSCPVYGSENRILNHAGWNSKSCWMNVHNFLSLLGDKFRRRNKWTDIAF